MSGTSLDGLEAPLADLPGARPQPPSSPPPRGAAWARNRGGLPTAPRRPVAGPLSGFGCGPGNCLMDLWAQQHLGAPQDADGAWAAGGKVDPALLQRLLDEPFFKAPPPK